LTIYLYSHMQQPLILFEYSLIRAQLPVNHHLVTVLLYKIRLVFTPALAEEFTGRNGLLQEVRYVIILL
jgi:hypothetical protein